MKASVVLANHDPKFAVLARHEARRWQDACGAAMTGFHHIGSTAVPGLLAKPILDLMPVFNSLEQLDALRSQICALGVVWRGEYGMPGRRYCKRTDSEPVQHIHCYAAGDSNVMRHLAFRDYLRAHPSVADDYADLKQLCAVRCPHDQLDYGDCKSDWIDAKVVNALAWYKQRAAAC